MSRAASFFLCALWLSSIEPVALAEESAPEGSGGDDSAYLERIVEGHRLFTNNERDRALRAYRDALEARPDDARATYYVACSLRATGELQEALETFRRAASLAGDDDALHAHALFNVALVLEALRDLPAAQEAWRAYIAFAESHQNVATYVANARQRLEAITAVQELDTAYQPVRQRIAERAAHANSSN